MKLLLNAAATEGGAATTTDWTTGLGDDVKPLVQSKGWKSPADVIGSYRNLEKVLGNNIAKPQPDWDDAKWGEFYKAAGRPEAPDKYELPNDALKDTDIKLDDDRVKKWRDNFHKLGLSDRQAKALWAEYLKDEVTGIKSVQDKERSERETAEMKLRNDWGANYDANLQMARAALQKVGPEFTGFLESSRLGNHPELVKLFHTIATKIGEDKATPQGGGGGGEFGAMTPEVAKAEIDKLKGDKAYLELFMKGDKGAVNKWNQLHQQAYPKEKQQ